MKKNCLAIFIFIFVMAGVLANSEFLIYLDESGNAEFLGSSDNFVDIPEGIIIEEGKVSGETQELTSKQGDVWSFEFGNPESDIEVIFPENSIVLDSNGEVYLGNANMLGERRIRSYGKDKLVVSYQIGSGNSYNYFLIVLEILIILAVIYYFFYFRKGKQKNKREEILEKVLNEREKKIVEELKLLGKVKSNALARSTGIPKSSFFRHLHELEKKKIVKLSGEGKNKFVELT